MTVTDRLVYLQLQKTGCTQIASILKVATQAKQIGVHNRLPEHLQDRYIVGSVRNPWDWYVSLWAYGCGNRGALYKRATTFSAWRAAAEVRRYQQGPAVAAKQMLAELRKPRSLWKKNYSDSSCPDGFREWLRLVMCPARRFDLGEGYGGSAVSRWCGFYTYRYLRLYSKDLFPVESPLYFADCEAVRRFDKNSNLLDGLIRTETVADGIGEVLYQAGYALSQEELGEIRRRCDAKLNSSMHKPPAYYYDKATIQLVRNREWLLVEKYGYQAPTSD